ncbi:YitT family protein [Shouchella sp. 1P09AA]|uniref:YitT family protein n=1 Tax=unclassified Shouchella TaxID=2893065 RepID=UPI0039A0C4A8
MKNTIFIVVGTLLTALSITFIGMPNNIADGGLTGIALLFYHGFGASPAIVNIVGFLFILLISYKYLEKMILIKSAMTILLMSVFIYLTEGFGTALSEPVVAAVFYGFIKGLGFALILQAGSSIGGVSTIALVLHKKFRWNVVMVTFILDFLVVASSVFVIGTQNTLITIIALVVGKVVTDYVLNAFNSKKAFVIMSPKTYKIAQKVTSELSSTATFFNGSGVYEMTDQKILYIIVKQSSISHLRRIIAEIDNEAFVVVNQVKDVTGGTFYIGDEEKVVN